jgi:hypothetical protein
MNHIPQARRIPTAAPDGSAAFFILKGTLRLNQSHNASAIYVTSLLPRDTSVSIVEASPDVVRVRIVSKLDSFIVTWFPSEPRYLDLREELSVDVASEACELQLRRRLDLIQQDETFVKASLRKVHGVTYALTLCVEQSIDRGPSESRAAVAQALRGLRRARFGVLAA